MDFEIYKPIKRIFLDLDEVLVDFVNPAYDLIYGDSSKAGVEDYIKFLDRFNGDAEYRSAGFEKIRQQGPEWWANLPKLSWADELMNACKTVCDNVCILTAPGPLPEAAAGKWQWAIDNGFRHDIILTSCKTNCVSPGALLIDDREKYVDPWREAGGIGIQLRREWRDIGHHPADIIRALNGYTTS